MFHNSLLQTKSFYLSSTLLVNFCPKLCLLNDLALCLKLVLAIITDPGVVPSGLAVAHVATQLPPLPPSLSPWLAAGLLPPSLPSSWAAAGLLPPISRIIEAIIQAISSRAQVNALSILLPRLLTTLTLTPASSPATGSTLPTPSEQETKLNSIKRYVATCFASPLALHPLHPR